MTQGCSRQLQDSALEIMAASVAHDEMAAKTLSDRGSHEASSELVEDRVSGFGDQPNRKFREGLRESRGVRPNTGFPRIRVLGRVAG